MTSFIIKEDCPFGGDEFVKVIVEGSSAAELRKSFEHAMKGIRPEPNKFQKAVYGESLLNTLPDASIRKIVEENRGMGNTTAQAMKQVAEAIQNPNKPVKLESDHGDLSNRMLSRPGGYLFVVKGIIEKLDLKCMVVREAQCTLTFEV